MKNAFFTHTKNNVLQKVVGLLLALSASIAIAGAASTPASAASITFTGPGSFNQINQSYTKTVTKTNVNLVGVSSLNFQNATTGSALVFFNTFGGSATTGSATNYSSNNTWIGIYN